ncbi:MAG: hypothetical protein QXO24_03335 [Candidatus Micrarchaeaceae archaeon]
MSLVKYYKANAYRFLTKKHQCSKKSEQLRRSKVTVFLSYCDAKGITDINKISLQDKVDFLNSLNRSESTKKLYDYAIKEFFKKAHIGV